MPRSRIVGLYGSYIFSFLKDCRIVFHSCWTILHSHQRFQFFHVFTFFLPPSLHPYSFISLFFLPFFLPHPLIVATMVGVKWYHIMVLICIFLTVMLSIITFVLLVICISSLEKNLFKFFAYCFVLLLNGRDSLYSLDINPLSSIWFTNIFSPILFFFLLLILWWAEVFNFAIIYLFLFLLPLLLVSYPINYCQIQCHKAFPLFSSKHFIVWSLTSRSLFNLQLIFEYGVRYEVNFTLSHVCI